VKISFVLNGGDVSIDTEPLRSLLDVLREDFKLTGAKKGCGEGECGACAVLVNGRLINSCIFPAGAAAGTEIVTIEGFRETERYRVIEEAFGEAGSVQCGYCTPGMVLAAEALLSRDPEPDEASIREAISGNLCRCTGYNMIVEGIKIASERGGGVW
jgi:carbon-monoxide dehydrogenase small subunit